MNLLFALALLAQGDGPTLNARVDRTDVVQGDVLSLTITVTSSGADPVQIIDPILSGLEVTGFREQTSVSVVNGVPRRELTRTLQLVARSAGTATIGSIRARQGSRVAEVQGMTITVTAASAAAVALSPVVRALVDRAEPPPSRPEEVSVRVVALPDTLTLGAQVDLVTLAWFPRDVRSRLRTPPTLEPPTVAGAWSYERTTPSGIVASRQRGGQWFDLFVNHQVVFPLVAGMLDVERAVVRYRVPLTYSFLSRELEHVVESDSVRVRVAPFPEAGRPRGFAGAAGRGVRVALTAEDTILDGSTRLHVTIEGTGNVALWPEPEVTWPVGLRVYPGDVETSVASPDGVIRGVKRFSWLVVADSGGRLNVPPVRYPWFDLDAGIFRVAQTAPLSLIAPPQATMAAEPGAQRPLLLAGRSLADRVAGWPPWAPIAVLVLPPLVVLMTRLRFQLPGRRVPRPAAGALEHLEHRFRRQVGELVPPAEASEPRRLEVALRAAGVEPALAQHAARVGERLRGTVFGPANTVDTEELAAEVEEVLGALAGQAGRQTRGLASAVALLVLLLPAGLDGQSAEQLVDAGAWRAAADSFLARAAVEPDEAAHWYNAGVALASAGETERAHVAWRRAGRLAPRNAVVGGALAEVTDDPASERLAPIYPVRPEELWFLAGLLWIGGWVLVGVRRRMAGGLVIGAALAAVAMGVVERRLYDRPVAFAIAAQVPLREAPYGTAPAPRELTAGLAVRVLRADGRWLLVERGRVRGWVLAGEVARL